MLLEPIQLGRLARLRNEILQRITVQVSYRRKAFSARSGHSPGSRRHRPPRA
jgi:hypothetical protein